MGRIMTILSLDGGGVRGCLSAALLQKLDRALPNFVRDSVDLIAGTSTGAIIALMLANGASADRIADEYVQIIPEVFGRPRSMAARAFSAKYDVSPLRVALEDHFGSATLGRLCKKVCITALRIDGRASKNCLPYARSMTMQGFWRPAVFTNMSAVPGIYPDIELSCVDAALRSSAAPTFFPVHQGYVDGGLWANNPSTVALAKALLHSPDLSRKHVRILSIGTGQWRNAVHLQTDPDLGLIQWSPYLLDLLLDASSLNSELSASYMLKSNYFRLSPSFDLPIQLDDHRAIPKLLELAEQTDISDAVKFIRSNAALQQSFEDEQQPQLLADEDDEDASFEILGGSAARLHSHQWAELVDLAWIDAVTRPSSKKPA